jgi:hypothetical protein
MTGASGCAHGFDFGMGLAGLAVPAFAQHVARTDQDGPDAGIGAGASEPPGGKVQGAAHPVEIIWKMGHSPIRPRGTPEGKNLLADGTGCVVDGNACYWKCV